MSLRHALLGLLSEQPQSGWDLSRHFAETLGGVWPAGHPQIYGQLRKLLADELIAVHETGPRGRVVYEVTAAGTAEVTRWLTEVPVDHTMRLEPILRSVFFWLLPPDRLRAHLDAEAGHYRAAADQYRQLTEAKDRGDYGDSPQTRALRVAAEAGVLINEALAAWASWARDLERGPSDAGGG